MLNASFLMSAKYIGFFFFFFFKVHKKVFSLA